MNIFKNLAFGLVIASAMTAFYPVSFAFNDIEEISALVEVDDYQTECDLYCEAEQYIIKTYIDESVWTDETITQEQYDTMWVLIAILTEAKLNGELVEA